MTFDLPSYTAFFIVFFGVVALATVVLVGTLVSFFAENRPVRARRHQGVFAYYGDLVLGH